VRIVFDAVVLLTDKQTGMTTGRHDHWQGVMLDLRAVADKASGVVRDAITPLVSSKLGQQVARDRPLILAFALFVLIFTTLYWRTP
jgi:hypothetical protein